MPELDGFGVLDVVGPEKSGSYFRDCIRRICGARVQRKRRLIFSSNHMTLPVSGRAAKGAEVRW